jgi:hypothetical protein
MTAEYPTDEQLATLEHWPVGDPYGWLDYAWSLWWNREWGWPKLAEPGIICDVSTGGWSGNESIVDAMGKSILWAVTWETSRRGGHYQFKLPDRATWFKDDKAVVQKPVKPVCLECNNEGYLEMSCSTCGLESKGRRDDFSAGRAFKPIDSVAQGDALCAELAKKGLVPAITTPAIHALDPIKAIVEILDLRMNNYHERADDKLSALKRSLEEK